MNKTGNQVKVKERTTSQATQAYILYAFSFLLIVTIGTVLQIRSVYFGLAITELALILAPALFFVYRKKLPLAKALQIRPVSFGIAIQSIALGITGWGIAAGIITFTIPILGNPPSIPALEPETIRDLLWILFVAALLPGLCEEILFRGVLQGILSRKGQWKAILITALLFSVFHLNPWNLLPAFFLGLLFGVLVVRTGSLVPAVMAHIVVNATAFTVAYIFRDQQNSDVYPLMAGLAITFCVIFPFFWRNTRGIKKGLPILASVSAGVKRVGRMMIWMAGGAVGAIILSVTIAAFLLVEIRSMPDDSLAPTVHKGDQLVMLNKGMMIELDLEPGDVISAHQNGEDIFHEVIRIEEDSIWVRDGRTEQALSRDEILGKMVFKISDSED